MAKNRISTLRQVLRESANGSLEDAWVYLRDSGEVALDSTCLVLQETEESLENAASLGYPQEGLDTTSIEDCVAWAKTQEATPSDELLFYAFRYYWRFDAMPAFAWAPDPPPPHEVNHFLALAFYRGLGAERVDVQCKHQGCPNGAIQHSVLCRAHHYEMIRNEPCPFTGDA